MPIKRVKTEIVVKHGSSAIAGYSKRGFEAAGLDHLFRSAKNGWQEFTLSTNPNDFGFLHDSSLREYYRNQLLIFELRSAFEHQRARKTRPAPAVPGETIVFHLKTPEDPGPSRDAKTGLVLENTRASLYLDGELDTPATVNDVARLIGDTSFTETGFNL